MTAEESEFRKSSSIRNTNLSFQVGLAWPPPWSTRVVSFRSGWTHTTAYVLIDFETGAKSWAEMIVISRSWKGDVFAVVDDEVVVMVELEDGVVVVVEGLRLPIAAVRCGDDDGYGLREEWRFKPTVDPTNPIDPNWIEPVEFIFIRLLHYVARHCVYPKILPFAPLSSFVEEGVLKNLFYFCAWEYKALCLTGMNYDEHSLILFYPADTEEETDSDPTPLLGCKSRSRFTSFEGPSLDMSKIAALTFPSSIQERDIPALRARFGIPGSV
ncbi:hypothetical protein Vadar_011531 [Vaccinium darrowii]|uniref:Uncharacterized protein n=1 Tax=Vaccinium darrowii TaxID=229202 RepID=A0ACB7Z2Y9_9ERIC|nr:hypothetical protein Vadar_011531 [Vaccinium darrowii]